MKVLTSIKFLARQGLPLRGDGIGELEGNFNQLIQLRSIDESDGKLAEWIKKKCSKYDIQNEILQVMALCILRSKMVNVQL